MADSRLILTFFAGATLFFFNCNGPQHKDQTAEADSSEVSDENTAPADSSDACFLNTSAGMHPDSAFLHLTIRNGRVNGSYDYIPYEKDARRGTVEGTKTGDTLDLTWAFMQEGMTDTLRVVFKEDGQNLLQKPLSVDGRTGRQATRDRSQFSVPYLKVTCK